MFNKEFFPTPPHVLDMMGIDCVGKICLEPSAGKGDIVDYIKEWGAKEVLACELNNHLNVILQRKCRVIGADFFRVKSEDISHVQCIVMNPPFSNADKHILHAWKIAPEGCEIIALCNYETVSNNYSGTRKELSSIIKNNGESSNLGDVFGIGAERKTDTEIALVKIFKPATSSGFDFDGFYYLDDDNSDGEGIMKYNEIRAIVNSYVAAVKCWDKFEDISDEMNQYTNITGFGGGFSFNVGYNNTVTNKEDFAKNLQKHCWKHVFNRIGADKYLTKGVKEDINKFVEQRQNYPFTMKNIYRMIEILVGTRSQTMDRAIVEAMDKFTKYTHENRYVVEGWKTNAGHMLNKKFITGWICEPDYSNTFLRIRYYQSNFEDILDLTKAIAYIMGKNFDGIPQVTMSSVQRDEKGEFVKTYKYLEPDGTPTDGMKQYFTYENEDRFIPNIWYDWGFFEFKVFKKGTGHFKFKDQKVWETLNRHYAEIKGLVLPEKL